MKMRINAKKKLTIVTVFLAVVFLGGGFVLINMVNAKLELVSVYVYTREIDGTQNTLEGKIIKESDIQEIQCQKGSLPKNAVTNKEDIIGKTVNTIVYPDTIVYQEQINEDSSNIFSELFAKAEDIGKLRTCTVEMSLEAALGGNLKAGDRVDLTYIETKQRVETDENGYASNQENDFTYAYNFLEDVWVYKVQTQDGYKYSDYTDIEYGESKGDSEPLALVTFIGEKSKMLELQNRANTSKIGILGRIPESENYKVPSHVIGDYTKVFTGFAEIETNKVNLEK